MRGAWLLPLPVVALGLAVLPPPSVLAAPVAAVRLFGGATEGTGIHTVRLDCFERAPAREQPASLAGVEVCVDGVSYPAQCGAAGSVEVPIELFGRARRLAVRVTAPVAASGVLSHLRWPLAEGEVEIPRSQIRASRVARPSRIVGVAKDAEVEADIAGGAVPLGGGAELVVRVRANDRSRAMADCTREPLTRPVTQEEMADRAAGVKYVGTSAVNGRSSLRWDLCQPGGHRLLISALVDPVTVRLEPLSPALGTWSFRVTIPVRDAPLVSPSLSRDGKRLTVSVSSPRGAQRAHLRIDDDLGRRQATWLKLSRPPRLGWFKSNGHDPDENAFPDRTEAEVDWPVAFDMAAHPVLVVGFDDDAGERSHAVPIESPSRGAGGPGAGSDVRDLPGEIWVTPPALWLDGLPAATARATLVSRTVRGAIALTYAILALGQLALVRRWLRRRSAAPAPA